MNIFSNQTPQDLAKEADLRYVSDSSLGYKRVKQGKDRFIYLNTEGSNITDQKTLDRINDLKIPPAWTEVWICPSPSGHLQATGMDEKKRKQYIYHPKWIELSKETKFSKMLPFSEILPYIRERIERDMNETSLSQERILATIIWLLDNTYIRIGNQEYAQENKHYGLTTMRNKHVLVKGSTVIFEFVGKSGKKHKVSTTHPKVAKTIKKLVDIPGYELFQYTDELGVRHPIDSQDVNDYLTYLTRERITAKDFRTWGGTVISASTLNQIGDYEKDSQMKKNITKAVCLVANRLGNTPIVCRNYYIHPTVVKTYENKFLIPHFEKYYGRPVKIKRFHPEEYTTVELLKKYS